MAFNLEFFDIVNEMPVLKPEARLIQEFKAIITRDRGSVGDAEGRYKKQAMKELAFVYWTCDWRSTFVRNYSEEECIKRVIDKLGLGDWKPDVVVGNACTFYLFEQDTPSLKALQNAEAALMSANKLIGLVRRKMDKAITKLEESENEEIEAEGGKIAGMDVDIIYTDYQRLIKITTDLPIQIKAITNMQETVKKEMAEEGKGRKNRTVSSHQL